jgi:hypothetical protein
MNPTGNGAKGLREGPVRLATPPRTIVLGYYDGATNGVIQFVDGSVFRFDWVDEPDPKGDERSFGFAPLPPDAFGRLATAIAPYIPPTEPVWFPIWRFPSPEIQRAVEAEVDAILADAGPVNWVVTTSDYHGFTEFRAARTPAGQTI